MGNLQSYNKQKLIEQLRQMPVIYVACKKAGIGHATFYRWRQEDPEFAKQADEALKKGKALVNDIAESRVIEGIQNRDRIYVMFWLNNNHPEYGSESMRRAKTVSSSEETQYREALEKMNKFIRDFADAKDDDRELIWPDDESEGSSASAR